MTNRVLAAALVAAGIGGATVVWQVAGIRAQAQGLEPQQIDLEVIMPCPADTPDQICTDARRIIMSTCQGCHMFARVVRGRFDEIGWTALIERHRPRVQDRLTEEQIVNLRSYLIAAYPHGVPQPVLPEVFRENN